MNPATTSDPVELVLQALSEHGVRRSGDSWVARCPAHNDGNPSLSISRGDNGNALLFCHAGCDTRDILAAVDLTQADLFPDRTPRTKDRWRASGKTLAPWDTPKRTEKPSPTPAPPAKPAQRPKLGPPVAVYRYHDGDGTEVFSKLRFEPKTFRVRRPDGSWGIGDAPRVLYRLPELRAAILAGKPVLIVEGEKDADRATAELGMAATCNYDGASAAGKQTKWRDEYNEPLRDARVLVIADHDDPGIAHANHIREALTGIAREVGVFRPALDTPGADLSDHLDAGYTLGQLVPVARPTPEPEPVDAALPMLAPWFWEARPHLGHIRQAAHAGGGCADLVLFATLARLSAMVSPKLTFDSGVKVGSLNLFAAVVGPSGAGKSTGASTAAELIPTPPHLRQQPGHDPFRDGLPVGSGEGLAEAYMGIIERGTGQVKRNGEEKTEKVRGQVREHVFVYVDEGEALTRMTERSGSTIGPILRSGWGGEVLGQANARAETTRILPARSYALGVLMGFQRHTCQTLLADATAGTPQRFIWCSAIDPTIPDVQPEHPGSLHVPLTDSTGAPLTGRIEFYASIRALLWQRKIDGGRGTVTVEELDSHRPLTLCKVSALLSVLDGRMKVTEDDWALAEEIWRVSSAVRDEVVAYGRRERAREQWVKDVRQREQLVQVAAETGQLPTKLGRLADLIAAHVGDDGALTDGAARQRLASRDRHLYNAAVDLAVDRGAVRRVEGGICRPLRAVGEDADQ